MYSDLQNIYAAFGKDFVDRYADRDNSGTADDLVIESAIKQADALIDGYIGARYQLPIPNPAPQIIITLSTQLAMSYIMGADITDELKSIQKSSIKQLGDISFGKISLPLESGKQVSSSGSVKTNNPVRIFNGNFSGY